MDFVGAALWRAQAPDRHALIRCVTCTHRNIHTISSSYDRERRILTWFRRCAECGAYLGDVTRQVYEPHFDPNGNDRVMSPADQSSGLLAGQRAGSA